MYLAQKKSQRPPMYARSLESSRFWIISSTTQKILKTSAHSVTKATHRTVPRSIFQADRPHSAWIILIFLTVFHALLARGGISANTTQQLALQISSNSRGFVFFHIPKFNRPNSPGRGLKIIIDSSLLLSSWQLLVLTDPIICWPISFLVRK